MRVLLYLKKPKIHLTEIQEKHSLSPTLGQFKSLIKKTQDEHENALLKLEKILKEVGIEWDAKSTENKITDLSCYDLAITLGGDGTLLGMASQVNSEGFPILPIRSSSSSVGYLCNDFKNASNILNLIKQKTLAQTVSSNTRILNRFAVTVDDENGNKLFSSHPILNDALFATAEIGATSKYQLQIGDEMEIQKSSGIWISSAAGSSAAIYAAGGRRLPLSSRLIQYKVRELYSPEKSQALLEGGVFEVEKLSFSVQCLNLKSCLWIDGRPTDLLLDWGSKISIVPAHGLRILGGASSL